MEVKSYRKKPVVIQAVQYTGKNVAEIYEFTLGAAHEIVPDADILSVSTMEGMTIARAGDYIIRGVDGEFYPCAQTVFLKTYVEVSHEDAESNPAATR